MLPCAYLSHRLLAKYYGLRVLGGIQGVLLTMAMLGAIIGPIFAGGVYDVMDSYRPAFVLLALTAVTGAIVILMMGRRPTWTGDVVVAPTT